MSARDMVLAALGEHDQGAEEVLGVDDAEDAVTIALFYDADALGLDVLGETLGVIRFEDDAENARAARRDGAGDGAFFRGLLGEFNLGVACIEPARDHPGRLPLHHAVDLHIEAL